MYHLYFYARSGGRPADLSTVFGLTHEFGGQAWGGVTLTAEEWLRLSAEPPLPFDFAELPDRESGDAYYEADIGPCRDEPYFAAIEKRHYRVIDDYGETEEDEDGGEPEFRLPAELLEKIGPAVASALGMDYDAWFVDASEAAEERARRRASRLGDLPEDDRPF